MPSITSQVVLLITFLLSTPEAQIQLPESNIFLSRCNSSDVLGTWIFNVTTSSEPTHVRFKTLMFNSCLDCNGCLNGSTPHTYPCDSGNTNQMFYLKKSGTNVIIQSKRYDTNCFHVVDKKRNLIMLACDGSSNQTFKIDGNLLRANIDNSLCLSAPSISCNDQRQLHSKFPALLHPYCDTSLSSKARAVDLVSRMTLWEKSQNLGTGGEMGVSRMGVGNPWFGEALHGVLSDCGEQTHFDEFGGNNTGCPTSFPHGLALGSTFNRSLWTSVGSAISTEVRALHNQWKAPLFYWTPDINLFRDPRWGRGQEVPGEDPFLNGEYIMRYSRAFQWGEDKKYLKALSTAKHFADYDCENCKPCGDDMHVGLYCQRDHFNALVNDQDQVEYYWPAFRAAIEGAHVSSVMCSYNAVNGIPSCGNDLFLNEILRNQWDFDGYVVSDCGAISEEIFNYYIEKKYHNSSDLHVWVALTSGCDIGCDDYYAKHAIQAVKNGIVKESTIDAALIKLYERYIMLGRLDPDGGTHSVLPYSKYGPDLVDNPKHRSLALSAASQAMILLQNNNSLLPLKKSTKVALLGPHYNSSMNLISIYHPDDLPLVHMHTPYISFQKLGATIVGVEPGCAGPNGLACLDTSGFANAAHLAKTADVAIVFVGLCPNNLPNHNDSSDCRENEGKDRPYTYLPGRQEDLIKAVQKANPKTIVVVIHGASLTMEWTKANVPAILDAHYPGEIGGDAIFNAIYGIYPPAGRVTTTYYPSSINTMRNISDMGLREKGGITYKYYTGDVALWPFGFGLSYTTFKYTVVGASHLNLATYLMGQHHSVYFKSSGSIKSPALYTVNVTNKGNIDSDCVVLGFISSSHEDQVPNKELFDFSRIHVQAGHTVTVHLSVPAPVLSIVDKFGVERILPGEYNIEFGVEGSAEGHPVYALLSLSGDPIEVFSLSAARENMKVKEKPQPWAAKYY